MHRSSLAVVCLFSLAFVSLVAGFQIPPPKYEGEALHAELETCATCQLNRMPVLKEFVHGEEGVKTFERVGTKFIPGKNPDLVFYKNVDDYVREVERIDIRKYDLQDLFDLLNARGFKSSVKSPRERFQEDVQAEVNYRVEELTTRQKLIEDSIIKSHARDGHTIDRMNLVPSMHERVYDELETDSFVLQRNVLDAQQKVNEVPVIPPVQSQEGAKININERAELEKRSAKLMKAAMTELEKAKIYAKMYEDALKAAKVTVDDHLAKTNRPPPMNHGAYGHTTKPNAQNLPDVVLESRRKEMAARMEEVKKRQRQEGDPVPDWMPGQIKKDDQTEEAAATPSQGHDEL